MVKHPQYVWWNCLLCFFRMRDDGSIAAARRMGRHIEKHEREEDAQRSERCRQITLEAQRKGISLSARELEASLRRNLDMPSPRSVPSRRRGSR